MRLGRNQLTSISEVSNLVKLEELYVSQNKLTSLQGVEKLKKLTLLHADSNQLQNLAYVSSLKKLQTLVVNDNQLTAIPEAVNLTNLESLGISYNKIANFPNLAANAKLETIGFWYNQISEEEGTIRKKIPKKCFTYGDEWLAECLSKQNIDYSIDFIEPANIEMINGNTTKIAGRIHMPAEKMQITIDENMNDDDDFTSYIYADVDENGYFVFDHLDLKKFGGRKCEISIGICLEYDKEHDYYIDSSMRWYRIK